MTKVFYGLSDVCFDYLVFHLLSPFVFMCAVIQKMHTIVRQMIAVITIAVIFIRLPPFRDVRNKYLRSCGTSDQLSLLQNVLNLDD